jgi:hypothetical protein
MYNKKKRLSHSYIRRPFQKPHDRNLKIKRRVETKRIIRKIRRINRIKRTRKIRNNSKFKRK